MLEHRLFVVSDELHADLTYDGGHVPFATLSPELSRRTVTLLGPTKAFNLAGLRASFAIAEDPEVLDGRFQQAAFGYLLGAPSASQAGRVRPTARAARGSRTPSPTCAPTATTWPRRWRRGFPAWMHSPEATYLAWLDFRATPIGDDPAAALLERGRLGLNDGATYGEAGRGFARLNFATSRAVVDEALDRIARVLAEE